MPQGQGDCPNDKLTVVPATKPAPDQDCASLGQTGSGTDPIIDVETVKQALDGSATKVEVDQRLEPLQNKDCLSLIQNDSGTDPIIDVTRGSTTSYRLNPRLRSRSG